MDELQKKHSGLEKTLAELRSNRKKMEIRINELNGEIKEKIELHNNLVSSIVGMKKDYKERTQKFGALRNLVKEYKKSQRLHLEKEYKKQIERIVQEINSLPFDLKLNVFRSFDTLKAIKTSMFPILNDKKEVYFNTRRALLKKKIFHEIKMRMQDPALIADLIFYINFMIKYEMYFEEEAFMPFLAKKLEKEFEYHFLSDRESNRLDKPEWFMEFLLRKYDECEHAIQIYSDCRTKSGLSDKSIAELISYTQHLVFQKLTEIAKLESSQQRNLILNFATRYKEYAEKIKDLHSFDPGLDEIRHVLSSVQYNHIKSELSKIHELRYVQWFDEYKKLCKDTLVYICKFGDTDTSFKFKDLVSQILSHARLFIENFRFINREEIKAVLYIFSEFEDLKAFISDEERETSLAHPRGMLHICASSVDKITVFNAEIFKLIKKLAASDIESILRKIAYFTYSSNETRRTVIVEINRVIDEYKICIYSDLVEKTMQEKIDEFLLDEILLKVRFSSDEYLEFRSFLRSLKKIFTEYSWKSDDACRCIDAIFEDRAESGQLFKTLKFLYDK
ncbi:uncharacterized protein VICG_00124 [Vittaforma corneae ATCC 50505]|uniref:Exocyst complex component Sec6 n=1 Tax=Vittaforma corneae (strain ATCC 50505) TaxID=993615 RepID=L2GQB6_VITCO|nr:uncharacterized protein VICG_00124 [Vittaforma corneae ATCC 50505]ELA42809.1 hypothetical protein VICG_00124 [Vittaforma corneae ATCC 50505]